MKKNPLNGFQKHNGLKRVFLLLTASVLFISATIIPFNNVNASVLPGELMTILNKGISRLDQPIDDCIPVNPDGSRVTWIGDSLTIGAKTQIESRLSGVDIYAQGGKTFGEAGDTASLQDPQFNDIELSDTPTGISILKWLANPEDNKLRDYVVLALGTNHIVDINKEAINAALDIIGENRSLILVTNFYLGNDTEYTNNNNAIQEVANTSNQVTVADWYEIASQNNSGNPPTNDFISDGGVHLTTSGSKAFVDVVFDAISLAWANGEASSGSSQSDSDSNYSEAQVKSFAHQPINSTFGVTDSAVEEWFLGTGTSVIGRYGLNASNIGQVTEVVKVQNISVALFYAYTVNEGGGAGGFINHYANDTSGEAVGNATRDARYLAEQSKAMGSSPSWIDAGNPLDFVPQSAKDAGNADFESMPSGAIGRAYIPATAAAAWEVYYPNGLKKEYNGVQNYGAPLQSIMKTIAALGGNPLQGSVNFCEVSNDFLDDNTFTFYNQCDEKWGGLSYSTGNMCSHSCGITSFAMAATAILGKEITPADVREVMLELNRDSGVPLSNTTNSEGFVPSLAKHYGINYEVIERSIESARNALKQGKIVHLSGKGFNPFSENGHYIIIRGVLSNGKWKIGDSGTLSNNTLEWDPEDIASSGWHYKLVTLWR